MMELDTYTHFLRRLCVRTTSGISWELRMSGIFITNVITRRSLSERFVYVVVLQH
jgi:hypothetical protein